jgi:hypothetical protein
LPPTVSDREVSAVLKRRLVAASIVAALGLGGVAPAAVATGGKPAKERLAKPAKRHKKAKCNAGRGNGSEPVVNTRHCTNGDPGNSWAAGNRGGD